jgi:hypothetical protein
VRECNFVFDAIPGHREQFAIAIPGGLETDTLFDKEHAVRGRIVRERWPLHGSLTVDTAKGGDALKLHITVANESDVDAADLATTLRTSFLSLSLNVNAA